MICYNPSFVQMRFELIGTDFLGERCSPRASSGFVSFLRLFILLETIQPYGGITIIGKGLQMCHYYAKGPVVDHLLIS